jgi:hypothetical protein
VVKYPPREETTAAKYPPEQRGATTLTAAKHLPERGDQGDFGGKASARATTTTTLAAKHPPE